ncbi:hypothetical protein BJD55_gp138 [Gordonia phage Yvonnetastic]|uniref:Uncharacterized protein n=1 Tax=Gordonia phage Yvonnetastic TaxID=1821566 RepID=A0A142K945_9CAUD|nr:hypothetical protein BJD55_gp138 [Gordonia phage Yvonnetastic]AMS02628.1 hypothetical protein SEA_YVONNETASTIC_84 [Gordonia phage Yvonnetastic]WKW86060.1 hypothetical protein SEA_JONJAMES_86 [Gordonia Phage JonJames]
MSLAKRQWDHDFWVEDRDARAGAFNPCPLSDGFTLYEHWNVTELGPFLVLITSSPYDIGALEEGDFILKRQYAPAGAPEVYNCVRPRTP